MASLHIVVGRDMAVAIDDRMSIARRTAAGGGKGGAKKKGGGNTNGAAVSAAQQEEVSRMSNTLFEWLEFIVVRWGCNSTIAGSTAFAREVHDTMSRLLVFVRTADSGHFAAIVDAFADLKGRLTEHEPIVHGHDLELLVPLMDFSRWLTATSVCVTAGGVEKAADAADLAAFIRSSNAKVTAEEGNASSRDTTTAVALATSSTGVAAVNDGERPLPPKAKGTYSRIVANPSVSMAIPPARPPAESGEDGMLQAPSYRQALDAIIAASRKRNLHLVRVRRHVEEEAYSAMAGKAADMLRKAEEKPDNFSTVMKDVSIGLDMRLMALAGGVVGYYLCHMRGLDSGTCWVGAVCGVILMTIVDALLMIIRIGKDDVKASKARRREEAEKGFAVRSR